MNGIKMNGVFNDSVVLIDDADLMLPLGGLLALRHLEIMGQEFLYGIDGRNVNMRIVNLAGIWSERRIHYVFCLLQADQCLFRN
jgi:hypothetical protein